MQMLTKTMGSPLAFEYRREELRMIGGGYEDKDVDESYIGTWTEKREEREIRREGRRREKREWEGERRDGGKRVEIERG